MPIGKQHHKKKAKNYALMILLVAFISITFYLTIVKLTINV